LYLINLTAHNGKKGHPIENKPKTVSLKDFAMALLSWKYKTIRWREGSKGGMVSRFAAVRVQPAHGYNKKDNKLPPRQWLLIEWSTDQAEPCKFWFSNLLPQAGLRRLVRLAKIRWRVEQNYQQQKEELGLDHYEGRGFIGWHHHVTINMIAYGFLVFETLRNKKISGLTLPRIRRMLQKLLATWTGICPTCGRRVSYRHLSGFI
jgi:SRSO17 transposase